MGSWLDLLLVVVLVLNIIILGKSRLQAVIRLVAAQGVLLALISLCAREHVDLLSVALALALAAMKGGVIPLMLLHALRDIKIKREVEPFIGLAASMILGALATGFAMIFAARLPLQEQHTTTLLVPAALATVFAGFIVLVTRYKAISQVIGYLILENGIFIFGMLLVNTMPEILELGVLLDLFVCIFVVCIIVKHINRAFSSEDTRQMSELKE